MAPAISVKQTTCAFQFRKLHGDRKLINRGKIYSKTSQRTPKENDLVTIVFPTYQNFILSNKARRIMTKPGQRQRAASERTNARR
jgi:hypothetical protein